MRTRPAVRRRLYREQTAAAIREGQALGRDDYKKALRARADFRDRLTAAMSGIDLWLAPSASGPAPRGLASTGPGIMCLPWSGAGLPSVSLPAGTAPGGLPLGLQCVGPPGADEELLVRAAVIAAVMLGRAGSAGRPDRGWRPSGGPRGTPSAGHSDGSSAECGIVDGGQHGG